MQIEPPVHLLRKTTDKKNPISLRRLLQQILNKYIPIFHLWGSLLTSHSTVPECTTQGTIENRFRILKFIGLDGRKNRPLDDFAKEFKRQTIEIQRLAAKDSLKYVGKLKRKRNSSTVRENWCTKKKSDFLDNVGTFQKAPSQPLSSLKPTERVIQSDKDSVCPIDNLGATCWFNATMQSLCVTNMAKGILRLLELPQST